MKKGTKKIGKTKVFQQICPISLVCIRPLHFTCPSSILVPVVFTRDPSTPAPRGFIKPPLKITSVYIMIIHYARHLFLTAITFIYCFMLTFSPADLRQGVGPIKRFCLCSKVSSEGKNVHCPISCLRNPGGGGLRI